MISLPVKVHRTVTIRPTAMQDITLLSPPNDQTLKVLQNFDSEQKPISPGGVCNGCQTDRKDRTLFLEIKET